MANHKKARHPAARAHCSMCKPWKDGVYPRGGEGFERHSDRVRRVTLGEGEPDAPGEAGGQEGGDDHEGAV